VRHPGRGEVAAESRTGCFENLVGSLGVCVLGPHRFRCPRLIE